VTTYSRSVTCTKGHRIEASFTWNPDEMTGAPKEFSEACPASRCDGRVAGKLPVGTDLNSLRLREL
jgi:hypothetical protein